jgi:hypothetical protein
MLWNLWNRSWRSDIPSSLSFLPLKIFCLFFSFLKKIKEYIFFSYKAGYVTAFAPAFPRDIGIMVDHGIKFYLHVDKKKCWFGYSFGYVTLEDIVFRKE